MSPTSKSYGSLHPKFDKIKGRWVVDVPRGMNAGKRARRFFATEGEALRASAEIAVSHSLGALALPSSRGDRIRSLAAQFLAEKRFKVEKCTLRQLTWGITMFCEKFGDVGPTDITPDIASKWIANLPLTERGRFNVFNVVRSMFNWRGVRAVCPLNPFEEVPPKRAKGARLPILTPKQMRLLLHSAFPEWMQNWLVLGAFAGVRPIETHRIFHENIDWEFKDIAIRADQSKQGQATRPRNITVQDAFARHFHAEDEGSVIEGWTEKLQRRELRRVCSLLKLEAWGKHCLRHSFASYHLAHYRDAAKTAFEMGHTNPTLLYETYANTVTRRDAEAWWAL